MNTKRFQQFLLIFLVALSILSYIFLISNHDKAITLAGVKKEQPVIENEKKSSSMLPDFEIVTNFIKTISKLLPSN